ncbi:MAG: 2-amino-4-hydroxy-6-hydroxymethyldihydropteridine diphosphokinase [Gammaproteobacteria bacterium]|nr:2-amino-4-hydroxy-6-hydroxymethyldihydropteridine diphosphokinase [Gammaproteobacteria bacterium]MDH3768735.1 2-amino-4-hydroxy-6-hydroxymethyldihydropteridine diphosphokinase [Gammaproteobacteria bacterium]
MPDRIWSPAFIAVGSNLDGPRAQVEAALVALGSIEDTCCVATSPLYQGPPMGPQDQPDYVNAVAALLTQLEPAALFSALLDVERALGRGGTGRKWGPRRIDLDLLLHGDNVREGRALTLPHPGLAERAFVLQPLADLAPTLRLPDGRRIADLLYSVDCSELRRL